MPRGRPSRQSVYARLDEAIADLNRRLGGLPSPVEAEDIWSDLWHQEAHHSTAIEGNTLVLSQVRKLLDEGRAVGDKELREYMEVIGYADAAQWVYGQGVAPGDWTTGRLLSLQEVRSVHYRVMTPVWNVAPHPHAHPSESPGNWREHEIKPFPEGMQPPPFTDIDALMRDWVNSVDDLRSPQEDEPFAERLARVHNAFECIHPFLDGNGRTGRLLLNLVLARLGYPPAIIFKNERTKYLTAMRKADNGHCGPLGEHIARAVTSNLYRFVVPAVPGPARLVPLASLADEKAGLSAAALRVAAHRGRLRAQKQPDGTWMSSRKWVAEYQANRYRR
ncbi:MAG TPA: Fic family protein [Jatrophihabitans sp.]|uniref:Fic family protein n=1 Tax=Jatrophihabitans sp. TaxID=1932789 RepID=UPI002EF90A63